MIWVVWVTFVTHELLVRQFPVVHQFTPAASVPYKTHVPARRSLPDCLMQIDTA